MRCPTSLNALAQGSFRATHSSSKTNCWRAIDADVARRDTLRFPRTCKVEVMAAGIHLPGSNETIDLQQQVARLQALLEASRQVHSTIREEAVLECVLRIVVRELEMAGAAFPGTGFSYGAPINSIPVNPAPANDAGNSF